jgi:hypothetical protein
LVDVFAVGPCEIVELKQFALEILSFMTKVLPGRTFSFRFRFQIPSAFFSDKLFAAFILAVQLHGHGKFYNLNRENLSIYKLKCLDSFKPTHDKFLGTLDLNLTYPFHNPAHNNDDGGCLQALGWALVDVDGDGNCGFYSLILGLHNNNRTTYYNPFYFTENGERIEGQREIDDDALALEWQKQTVRLRRDLRNHSIRLLRTKYKLGQEPTWWWTVGPMTAEDRIQNNDNLYMRGYGVQHYFPRCDDVLMMIGTWGGFVFASKFRMRVVLIQRRHTDTGWDWTTHIYSGQENDEPQVFSVIHRLSDDEYRERPTVEFFQTSGAGLDPHFQFLRRVYSDQATDFPLDEPLVRNNKETLLFNLKSEQRKQTQSANKAQRSQQADDTNSKQKSSSSSENAQRSQQNKASTDLPKDISEQHDRESSHDPIAHQEQIDGAAQRSQPNEASADVPADNSDKHKSPTSHDPLSRLVGEPNEASADVPLDNSQQHQSKAPHDPNPRRVGEPNKASADTSVVHQSNASHASLPQRIEAPQLPQNDNAEPFNEPYLQIDNSEPLNQPVPQVDNDEPINEPLAQVDNVAPINVPLRNVNKGRVSQGKTIREPVGKNRRETQGKNRRATKRSRRVLDPEEDYDHAFFDLHYHAQTLRHKTAARMKYDAVLDTYWISQVRGLHFTEAEEASDIDMYDDILVNQARRNPGVWQGCTVGDPHDGNMPSDLATTVRTPFRQHNNKHCLTLSLANALFYCELVDDACLLDTQARVLAGHTFEIQLHELLKLMSNLVPLIGRPTIFREKRSNIDPTKKRLKKAKQLTWDTLFSEIVPHPTVVIPLLADGTASHAFCVVDDLIFDSSFPFALKLQKESVDWIFNKTQVSIYQAFRFNKKVSPKGNVVEGWFDRKVTLNWVKPSSAVFMKRTRSDWFLPHYIVKK